MTERRITRPEGRVTKSASRTRFGVRANGPQRWRLGALSRTLSQGPGWETSGRRQEPGPITALPLVQEGTRKRPADAGDEAEMEDSVNLDHGGIQRRAGSSCLTTGPAIG